jgi:two-component system cell cycle response regulator
MFAPSLRTKLTLALLFVGLASAIVVGLVARQILLPIIDRSYVDAFRSAMFYGVGAAALLAIALGLVIGIRLSHRLTSLTTAINAMASGDLYQHVDEGTADEVGVLARVFNQMSRELFESRLRIETQTQMLRELSVRDDLTGLHNRRHFDDQAATAFAHARRYRHRLTVMMCDIDHFKTINDRFSHATGDEVLRHVARILQANTRASDIVARYGGEEFAVVFTESEPDAARGLAERIRERIEQHDWSEIDPNLQVTISIGLDSTVTRQGVAEMLAAADERLYQAKRGGRNRVIADS